MGNFTDDDAKNGQMLSEWTGNAIELTRQEWGPNANPPSLRRIIDERLTGKTQVQAVTILQKIPISMQANEKKLR